MVEGAGRPGAGWPGEPGHCRQPRPAAGHAAPAGGADRRRHVGLALPAGDLGQRQAGAGRRRRRYLLPCGH
ncbi:hypothetical protein G6F60_015330 [Rhizopus arrhizus]|nr:hypothetical protein G6F60_015330 [Rhizopus arrhizus]